MAFGDFENPLADMMKQQAELKKSAQELQYKRMEFMVGQKNKQDKFREDQMKDYQTMMMGQEKLQLLKDNYQTKNMLNNVVIGMIAQNNPQLFQQMQTNQQQQPTQRPMGVTAWQQNRIQQPQQQQIQQQINPQMQGQEIQNPLRNVHYQTGQPQNLLQQQENGLSGLQRSLPPGVSFRGGPLTITGTDVGTTQQKDINAIRATRSTIDRIVKESESVPDIGQGAKGWGRLLSPLPRGLEARARAGISEFITAGEGGGIGGLTREQDENLRTYVTGLPTAGAEVYKAFSGDTGRLSDFDIERGKNLLWRPDLGETKAIRDKKNKILKEAISERERARLCKAFK